MAQIIEKEHEKNEINSSNPIDTNISYLGIKTLEGIKEFGGNGIRIAEMCSAFDTKTLVEFENLIKEGLYLNKKIETNIA